MRKTIYSVSIIIALLIACVPVSAKEWYEGGTLHQATIAQWKRASQSNKLATCADWISALYMNGKLDISISGMNDVKTHAEALVDYVDSASKNTRSLDGETANSVAIMGMMLAGWIKGNDTTDSRPVLIDPASKSDPAEEADKKLKANGFLVEDEIDEIYEAEQTPDVLSKVTEDQQKAIVSELQKAQEVNARESQKFGSGIKDEMERSMYQDGVYKNKMLKARRAIAKKYGIQAGDISAIEAHVKFPD